MRVRHSASWGHFSTASGLPGLREITPSKTGMLYPWGDTGVEAAGGWPREAHQRRRADRPGSSGAHLWYLRGVPTRAEGGQGGDVYASGPLKGMMLKGPLWEGMWRLKGQRPRSQMEPWPQVWVTSSPQCQPPLPLFSLPRDSTEPKAWGTTCTGTHRLVSPRQNHCLFLPTNISRAPSVCQALYQVPGSKVT